MKTLPAAFYRMPGGREPVRDFLRALPATDRRVLGRDIAVAEFGWPIGMPLCRALGGGLYEIRSELARGRAVRVIFCLSGGSMVLLHAFVKKTRRIRRADLTLARERMGDLD